jgi:hypothetical protein
MEPRKSEVPIDTIEQRLERLERDSRRWKALTILAMVALSLVLLIGAGKSGETSMPNELQAQAFVLVDRNGTPLARLGLLPHGAWGLGFYDQGKKSRIVLSVEGDGASSISLFGKDGKGGLLLSAHSNGASSLRLVDTHWKTRTTLATWPDGSPFLQLTDRDGKDRALLRYTEVTARGTGELIKRPGPSLLFFDQEETVVWQAP